VRTNLAFHSESWVSVNNWALTDVTNVTGATSAPNGTATANALSPTAVSDRHFVFSNATTTVSYASGTIYTQSAFFKAGTGAAGQFVQLTFPSARFTQAGYANFDLIAGTVSVVSGSSADANRAARIENYGNGWYRCIFTATCDSSGTGAGLIIPLITSTGSGRVPSFAGVTGDVLYGWGAQVETGSVATTYIPTTTAAVSRAADVISASGALVSSLIGQTEGVLYCEFTLSSISDVIVVPNAYNSAQNYVGILHNGTNSLVLRIRYRSGGSNLNINFTQVATIGTTYKVAIGYKSGDSAAFVNGVQVGSTDTTAFAFENPLTLIEILVRQFYSSALFGPNRIRAVALYTTRLSNDQLAELTRL
jgi:hypothetical protein